MLMALTRTCTSCGSEKPLTAFATRKTHRPGKPVSQCMDCKVAYNRAYRQANKEQVYEIERKSKIKKAYGISVEDYDRMLKEQGGGSIINTGSVVGLRGSGELVDYAATKGAIHAFTFSLAKQLMDRGIRVNCVAPGPVWTPLDRKSVV